MVNSLRKVYLRFVSSIGSSIAYSETSLKPPNVVMAEMTSSDKLINEGLGEVRVRRSVALLRSLGCREVRKHGSRLISLR